MSQTDASIHIRVAAISSRPHCLTACLPCVKTVIVSWPSLYSSIHRSGLRGLSGRGRLFRWAVASCVMWLRIGHAFESLRQACLAYQNSRIDCDAILAWLDVAPVLQRCGIAISICRTCSPFKNVPKARDIITCLFPHFQSLRPLANFYDCMASRIWSGC